MLNFAVRVIASDGTYNSLFHQQNFINRQKCRKWLFQWTVCCMYRYLKCVSGHMRDIQPFEDVPHKLSVQLRRAFVATRTFHKALRAGADVVRDMLQVRATYRLTGVYNNKSAAKNPP